MTRIGRRDNGRLNFGTASAMSLILGLGLAWSSTAQAARLSRFLTAQDLAGRMVLDQNGQQIELPTASNRHPEVAKGSMPTYLAIPLHGGEHLPASIPALETGSQQGESPVGPLNFDAVVKANLNTTLNTSQLAVVDTPNQNYLVAFMPRRKHSASLATNTVNEISRLLKTGSTQLNTLTQGGMNSLEKFLHISSKNSATTPILNLQAQVLNGGDVLPSAIPEPGTWMVFASLLAGGVMLRRRLTARLATS